ncbi:MAG: hypothetical protein K6C35_06605 [Eubacterium sp.]|nr:hypothetical protein [Eubacterium sp.]
MNVPQAVKKYKMVSVPESLKSGLIKRFACDDVHYMLETKKQMYYIFSNGPTYFLYRVDKMFGKKDLWHEPVIETLSNI